MVIQSVPSAPSLHTRRLVHLGSLHFFLPVRWSLTAASFPHRGRAGLGHCGSVVSHCPSSLNLASRLGDRGLQITWHRRLFLLGFDIWVLFLRRHIPSQQEAVLWNGGNLLGPHHRFPPLATMLLPSLLSFFITSLLQLPLHRTMVGEGGALLPLLRPFAFAASPALAVWPFVGSPLGLHVGGGGRRGGLVGTL